MASASADLAAGLEAEAVQLIDNTPSKEDMEGYVGTIKQKFIKNLKLNVDLSIEDSEEFTQELMANIASSTGLKASAADIQKWSQMTYDELSVAVNSAGVNLGGLANNTAIATAQAGLSTAAQAYGEAYSLFSITDGILEGKGLTANDAVQLGASAVSLASTVIAGAAGGAALGPYGAIVGVVLAGVSYLISKPTAALAAWEASKKVAAATTTAEVAELDRWNVERSKEFYARLDGMRLNKDRAVSEIADNWAAYEEELGVRFGLRYFPGSPVPPRAGVYVKTGRFYTKDTGGLGLLPQGCTSLAGCPYFTEPHPSRVAAVGYQQALAELVDKMAEKSLYLANPDSSVPLENQYVFSEPKFSGYYDRTLRAFSAYLGSGTFWTPPNQRPLTIQIKNYGHHLSDLECTLADMCGGTSQGLRCEEDAALKITWGGDRLAALRNCQELQVKDRYGLNNVHFALGASTVQDSLHYNSQYTQRLFNKFNELRAKDAKTGAKLSAMVFERGAKFWRDLNETLDNQNASTNVFKIRISADLLQTANAVGGELATSIRLQDLVNSLGTKNIQTLTQNEKRTNRAISPELATRLQRKQSRDGLINNGMLALGVGAFGYGAKNKWGK